MRPSRLSRELSEFRKCWVRQVRVGELEIEGLEGERRGHYRQKLAREKIISFLHSETVKKLRLLKTSFDCWTRKITNLIEGWECLCFALSTNFERRSRGASFSTEGKSLHNAHPSWWCPICQRSPEAKQGRVVHRKCRTTNRRDRVRLHRLTFRAGSRASYWVASSTSEKLRHTNFEPERREEC